MFCAKEQRKHRHRCSSKTYFRLTLLNVLDQNREQHQVAEIADCKGIGVIINSGATNSMLKKQLEHLFPAKQFFYSLLGSQLCSIDFLCGSRSLHCYQMLLLCAVANF